MKELKIKGKITLQADYSDQHISIKEEKAEFSKDLQDEIIKFFIEGDIGFPYEKEMNGEYEIIVKQIK